MISLDPSFMLAEHTLLDKTLGATHSLLAPADQLLALIKTGDQNDRLHAAALKLGITDQQYCDILGFLNTCGGLIIRRTMAQHMQAAVVRLQHALMGIFYPNLVHRKVSSLTAVASSVVRACLPVLAALLACCILMASSHMITLSKGVGMYCMGAGVLIGSVIIHEMGHLIVIRKYTSNHFVIQAGMRVGILHQELQGNVEKYAAISGPLAGCASCMFVDWGVLAIHNTLFAIIAFGVALFHIASLLPTYSDGAVLYRLAQKKEIS